MTKAIILLVLISSIWNSCLGNESAYTHALNARGFPLKCAGNVTFAQASGHTLLQVLSETKKQLKTTVKIPLSGLDFPSNGQTHNDVRFRFTDENLIPMYPATYIWRVRLRQQAGYYTTFFWGPDGPFTGEGYYGCHPYPDGKPKPISRTHKWELSIDGGDNVTDTNCHSTQLGYDTWKTQAFRAYDDGNGKVHEFYWDLPDFSKVIRTTLPRSYGSRSPLNPALTFGDAPWALGAERLSGILRGIQLYSGFLSLAAILQESEQALSTKAGKANIWYLNLNPTPEDIMDKSGKAHHPEWVSSTRASLWIEGSTNSTPYLGK